MDNLFTNVGSKLKAFAKTYFQVTMWLLIIGGVITFIALIAIDPDYAPGAFGVLLGVPAAILSNLVFCWILHAFGSIAEKHEDGYLVREHKVPIVEASPSLHPTVAPAAPSASAAVPEPKTTSAPAVEHEEVSIKNGLCPDCNRPLEDSTIVGIKECPDCGRMFG